MKIEVGDKLTGKWLDNNQIIEEMAVSNDFLQKLYKNIENNKVEILKIERPNWEVVEEKKELLTEEEREFLKLALKYVNKRAKYIFKNIYGIYLTNEPLDQDGTYRSIFIDYLSGKFFVGLEENKEYSLKELRIGGINK